MCAVFGASVMFTMPFTFSVAEYADMIYVYGFCDGNAVHGKVTWLQTPTALWRGGGTISPRY